MDMAKEKIQQFITRKTYVELAAMILGTNISNIQNFTGETAGMTNKSFRFEADGTRYIMRIPGAGTDELINRREEALVFESIAHLDVADETVFCDPDTGVRLAIYYPNGRICNIKDMDEVAACFVELRKIHLSGVTVPHTWSYHRKMDDYEKLCMKKGHIKLPGYRKARIEANRLMEALEDIAEQPVLCHIDCACINFLVLPEENRIRAIDWEYGAMFDPLIDLAHFAVHAQFNRTQADEMLERYLEREPADQEYIRLYGYMALGGLLWALWTEFKEDQGDDFGDYGMMNYSYFHKYSKILKKYYSRAMIK